MLNFEQVIPSKDVRDCMAKNGMELSDMDKAAIIYHTWSSIGLNSLDEMFSELREIAETTKDEVLKTQIKERLELEDEQRRLFRENNEGFVYVLNKRSPSTKVFYSSEYFTDEDSAIEYGKTLGREFMVEKCRFKYYNGVKAIPFKSYRNPYSDDDEHSDRPLTTEVESCHGHIGSKRFNEQGELVDFHSQEYGALSDEKICEFLYDPSRFENKFPNIPDPFECGDIVRFRDSNGEFIFGVVAESREAWEEYRVSAINKEFHANYDGISIGAYVLDPDYGIHGVRTDLLDMESYELGSDNVIGYVGEELLEATSMIVKSGINPDKFFKFNQAYIEENAKKNKF